MVGRDQEHFSINLLLLRIPRRLSQSPVADISVHVKILLDGEAASCANGVLNNPLEGSMRPPRGVGVGEGLSTAKADLAKSGTNKRLGARAQQTCAANLAHGSGNQVADNELNIDALGLELLSERAAPVLQECLAAAVGGQVRSGHVTGERTHGEDEALLPLHQDGRDNAGGLEGAEAVDVYDIQHLVGGSLQEWYGDAVGLADVVDQNAHIEALDKLGQALVVGVVILCVVHRESLRLQARELLLELGGKRVELRLGARDKDDVEALRGELCGELLADSIGCAGDNGPGALLAVLGKLFPKKWLECIPHHVNSPNLHCNRSGRKRSGQIEGKNQDPARQRWRQCRQAPAGLPVGANPKDREFCP